MKANLGCGSKKMKDCINIDISDEFNPDMICDITKGITLDDDSVDEVWAIHILEHINDIIFVMNEIWRICENGAIIHIEVPHQNNPMAFADPTHKRVYNEESFQYFCSNGKHYRIHKSYGIICDFTMLEQYTYGSNLKKVLRIKLKANK
jgi:predicted SAM-dependent methyltransferase